MNIKPFFSPLLSGFFQPFITPLIVGNVSKICRAIRFNGVNNYGQLANNITLSGDFEIEFAFNLSAGSLQENRFFGTMTSMEGRAFSRVSVGNLFQFSIFGSWGTSPASLNNLTIQANTNYKILISRAGSDLTLTELNSGAFSVTNDFPTQDGVISVIGRHIANYMSGVMHYIRINGTYWAMDAVGQAIQPSIPAGNDMTLFNTVPEQWETISCGLRPQAPQFAPYFNGANAFGVFDERLIDPDGDIDIEFWTPASVATGAQQVIIGQSLASNQALKEFELFVSAATGNLGMTLGGNTFAVANAGQYEASKKYRLEYRGTTSTFTDIETGQTVVRAFTRGTAREPSAPTRVGASGVLINYFQGLIPYIRINGTYYPLDRKEQVVQPSKPDNGNPLRLQNFVPENWQEINPTIRPR